MEVQSGNSTTMAMITDLPLLGWPGVNFYLLHIAALVSMFISIVSSVVVFAVLRPTCPSFWSRAVGERFTVYLAVSDLLHSVSHTADHSYMLAVVDHPPDDACVIMGYFVGTTMVVQASIVTFMSLNAFILVVKEIKISMGIYDWKLLIGTMVCPFLVMIPAAVLKWFGPTGGWCVFDLRQEMGKMLAMVLSSINIITVIINIMSYGFIYLKIKRVTSATQTMGSSTNGMKHKKAVQVMMKFVAAYIFQWWAHVVFAIWSQVAPVPFYWVLMMVIMINLGGFYNLVVYTLLRRMGPPKDKRMVKGPRESHGKNTSVKNTNGSFSTISSLVPGSVALDLNNLE